MAAAKRLDTLTESFERVLAFGLQAPDAATFQTYFPGLPLPVVDALLDLYTQVLRNINANSKDEFEDICTEHNVKAHIAEVERLTLAAAAPKPTASRPPAANAMAAELRASVTSKQQEIAHLELELERALSECDALRSAKQQRQTQVDQLAAGYQAVAGSMQTVYEASIRGSA